MTSPLIWLIGLALLGAAFTARDGMDVSTESWQDHCERIGVTLQASE